MGLQSALRTVFPPQCISCGTLVESDFALCGTCWRDAHFIAGLVCDSCGTPLPGEDSGANEQCDDCLAMARPWRHGRAVMLYQDAGRKLILGLKHGDRTELARPAAQWLARACAPILEEGMVVAPVPLHRWRFLKRRYNQSALLEQGLARQVGLASCPDLLQRTKPTQSQDGKTADERFANVAHAIKINPARQHLITNRPVLLIDDVMTSGATLSECTEACLRAGAAFVSVAVLARVAKQP